LWARYDALTNHLSQRLCEQLRLVLEPTLRSKLQGDYRTGKRINMKKIIPYIASQFRKDKIWLRRSQPAQRHYQVMIALDDSESMMDHHAGRLALEAMSTLCKAMTQLEVGDISVVRFGESIQLLHPFGAPFTNEAGARVIPQFTFQQKRTDMCQTLETISRILDMEKGSVVSTLVEYTQIVFVISDGRFDKDGRSRMKSLIRNASEKHQLYVLVIVDSPRVEHSIVSTKTVSFVKGKVEMQPYLQDFPFPYYLILPDTNMLPEVLSDALRQWFEMLQRD
jgi:midasin